MVGMTCRAIIGSPSGQLLFPSCPMELKMSNTQSCANLTRPSDLRGRAGTRLATHLPPISGREHKPHADRSRRCLEETDRLDSATGGVASRKLTKAPDGITGAGRLRHVITCPRSSAGARTPFRG